MKHFVLKYRPVPVLFPLPESRFAQQLATLSYCCSLEALHAVLMKLASGLAQQWLLVLPRPETRRGDMVLLRRCRRLSVPGAAVLGLFAAEAAVGMLCVCAFHTIPEISPYAILGAQPAGAQVVYGADTRRQQLVAGCGRRGHSLQTFGPDLSAVRRSVMFMAAEGGDKQPAEKEEAEHGKTTHSDGKERAETCSQKQYPEHS